MPMRNSKLIINLKFLTPKELRRFGEFLHSPFFNKHEETVIFYDLLFKNIDKWDYLVKEEVFEKIYPGIYNELKMNNLMSCLMNLLQQFLGQVEYEQSQFKTNNVLKATLKRSMWKLFKSNSQKERSRLNKVKVKDQHFYTRMVEFERLNDKYVTSSGRKHDPVYLENGELMWEIGVILEKLKQSCEMLNRMVMYNYNYDLGVLDYLLAYLKDRWSSFEGILIINAYYQVLRIFQEPDNQDHFYKLVEFLGKYRSEFNKEDLKLMYSLAVNRGIESLNLDEEKFSTATFKLYQLMIEDGLHLENMVIHHMSYKNITVLACKVGEFEWAKSFMDSHRGNLNVEYRKNAFNFNMAYLYFTQKKYEEALLLLSKLNFENVFYQINAKIMQLKIFYELKEFDLLLSFLESFRLFLIRNKKVSSSRINMTLKYVQYSRKFVQILNSKNLIRREKYRDSLQELKEELLETDVPMINKKWLMGNLELTLRGVT
jgi:hypothetical protein